MTDPARPKRRLAFVLVAGGLVLLLGLGWLIHALVNTKSTSNKRTVTQTVQIIRPPPPPPPDTPPPPPETRPKEEIPQDSPEPDPANNEPAPSEQLGLDAEGAAGGDAFGLAAHKGGRDLSASGGAAFAWYTGRLKDKISERLGSDAKLKARKFSVTVKIWVQSDGRIQDVQLATTTGNRELDEAIQASLASLGRVSDPPPIEMPQPVSMKIISRI